MGFAANYANSLLEVGGNQLMISLQNADYIGGWFFDPNSGDWYTPVYGPAGGKPIDIDFATAAQAQELNTEKQARIAEFGSHVLQLTGAGAASQIEENPTAGIEIGTQQLQGGAAVSGDDNVWSSNGMTYSYSGPVEADATGTMTISGSLFGAGSGSLVLQDFNLCTATGFVSGLAPDNQESALELSPTDSVGESGSLAHISGLIDTST